MASPILLKLVRNQSQSSAKTIIPLLNKPFLLEPQPLPSPPVLPQLRDSKNRPFQIPFLPQSETNLCHFSHFYPSFSPGLFLSPISSTGLIKLDDDDVVSGTIWADSVKKKRKRKMNKHKLRKLRRRLRKKT